jgi:hypothetical protein
MPQNEGLPLTPYDKAVSGMCLAHLAGDVAAVRDLLAAYPELERENFESSWLHRAAEAGQIGLIDFWLERGWEVDCDMDKGPKRDGIATPLCFAKDAATTRHLISRGAAVNVWSRYGGTPLHGAVVGAMEASQRGRRRATPDAVGDQIRVLLKAGADPSVADFEGQTPLALAVELGRKTAEKVLREAGAPEKGHPPPKVSTKAPRIDLRKDVGRVAKALHKAIKRFAREGSDKPVTGLFLAVSALEGFVMIAFDTGKENSPWDASHSEYMVVEFPRWRDAYDLMDKGPKVIQMDGVEWALPPGTGDKKFEKPFFDACVMVLEQAEKEDAFVSLLVGPKFTVGVEDTSGYHSKGWRPGRKRGTKRKA